MTISKILRKSLTILPIVGVILFSSISVKAELGDSLLKKGITHEDVKVLKGRLIDLNFLNKDETTTYYDDITLQAVKDFQNFCGLSEDGIFGPNTFQALQQVSRIVPLEYKRILKLDVKGEDVKALQERLKIMGFLNANDIEPNYGPKTRQAVSCFQEVYKLKVDGIAGEITIEAINKALSGNNRMRRPLSSRGSGSGSIDKNIISTAMKYIGTPYRFGGTTSSGIDCAGFTQLVYKSQGINIPRTSSEQANVGSKLNKDDLNTGDLIIFSNTYKPGPSHTGIYVGDGSFIHASSVDGVKISSLNENYYKNHFSYGRKVY